MGRARHPKRREVKEIYIKKRGKISFRELADYAGVSPSKIRDWKSKDRWDDELPKHKGAPMGNRNAAGAGAPYGNKNAEIHGAYTQVDEGNVEPETLMKIKSAGIDLSENLRISFEKLRMKEADLELRLEQLHNYADGDMLDEREAVTSAVKNGEWFEQAKTVSRVSVFERRRKLEDELDRVRGRIGKLLEAIRAYDSDCKRFDIEERRLKLSREKAMGVFEVDDSEDGDDREV